MFNLIRTLLIKFPPPENIARSYFLWTKMTLAALGVVRPSSRTPVIVAWRVKDPTRIMSWLTFTLISWNKEYWTVTQIHILWNKVKEQTKHQTTLAWTATGLSVTNPFCLGWEIKQISTHKIWRLLSSSTSAASLSRLTDTEFGRTSSSGL